MRIIHTGDGAGDSVGSPVLALKDTVSFLWRLLQRVIQKMRIVLCYNARLKSQQSADLREGSKSGDGSDGGRRREIPKGVRDVGQSRNSEVRELCSIHPSWRQSGG